MSLDGVGIERVEHLLAVAVETVEFALAGFAHCRSRRHNDAQVFENQPANLGDLSGSKRDGCPVLSDEFLKLMGLHGTEGATVLEAVPSEADKVVVCRSGAVP
nr:hypothetical protein [Aeromicrobium sp. Root344]